MISIFIGFALAQWGLSVGANFRLEEDTNGREYTLDSRTGFTLLYQAEDQIEFWGYELETWEWQLQYSKKSESSIVGSSQISLESKEYMFWFTNQIAKSWNDLDIFGGIGLGFFENDITTTLSGESSRVTSDPEMVLGLILELRYLLNANWSLAMNGKVIHSPYYSLAPTLELGLLRIYFYFD